MTHRLLNDHAHWARRAAETRALAESIADANARRTLERIAEEYETLARRAAESNAR